MRSSQRHVCKRGPVCPPRPIFGLMQRGNAPSFDDLVGSLKERFGDRKAESLRGLEVDNQFDFGRELDGEVAGLRAPQDEIDV